MQSAQIKEYVMKSERNAYIQEDVQASAGTLAALERVEQRLLVDNATARAIDNAHALLALGQHFAIDQILGLLEQRHVNADVVGLRPQLVECDELDLMLSGLLGGHDRIVADDAHAEGAHAEGDLATDAAETEQRQRLAVHLGAHELGALPFALAHRRVRLRHRASHGQDNGARQLHGADRVRAERIHDENALLGGRLHVDVVHAGAGACHQLELASAAGALEHRCRHLGRRAHHQSVVVLCAVSLHLDLVVSIIC